MGEGDLATICLSLMISAAVRFKRLLVSNLRDSYFGRLCSDRSGALARKKRGTKHCNASSPVLQLEKSDQAALERITCPGIAPLCLPCS
jgi:hypothetical protein